MVMKYKASEIDITNPSHVADIINEIEWDENRRRRRKAWRAYQCLEGNQKEYVVQALIKLYPETHEKFRVGDISVVKKVNDKLSKAYKQAPIRTLDKEAETNALSDMYDKYRFHNGFKEADRIYNLQKYVCLWVSYLNPDDAKGEDEGKYLLRALQPYEYDLIRHEVTGKVLVFIMPSADITVTEQAGGSDGREQVITESQSDTNAQTKRYAMWDDTNFVKVEVKCDSSKQSVEVTSKDITYMVGPKKHEIGRIPAGFVSQDSSVDYPVASNLTDQSIDWNVSFSDLKTASATQGHGQLVIKHPEGKKQKHVHMGMHTSINLPVNRKDVEAGFQPDAQYISASPDLKGQLDVLKFDLSNILDDQGIKAKGTIEGGVERFASGFDRLLSEADVQDIIEDNQDIYAETIEQEVYDIVKHIEDSLNKKTFTSETVSITFEKPKVMISDKETLENIEKRDKLGLMLDHEKHMVINPNLSEDDAKKREDEIRKQKQDKLKEFMSDPNKELNGPDDDPIDKEQDE
jgi:hypothetical protein